MCVLGLLAFCLKPWPHACYIFVVRVLTFLLKCHLPDTTALISKFHFISLQDLNSRDRVVPVLYSTLSRIETQGPARVVAIGATTSHAFAAGSYCSTELR